MTRRTQAFTLSELLVSITILVALVLFASQLFVGATNLTTSGHRRMDAEAQVRPLFQRFALDLAQMVKRADVDFFGKGTAAPNSAGGMMPGNDQFAFFSTVPGYHSSNLSPSPVSLVAYRIGANKLERMAKALVWNGASPSDVPILFLPLTIAGNWSAATTATADADYELIGPYVFRFEYHYLLKNGAVSVTPWDASGGPASVRGLQDVAAVTISLATLDPKSRLLIKEADLATLAGTMNDFSASMNPGDLLVQWQSAVSGPNNLPPSSLGSVRLFERTFSLTPKR